MLVTNFNHKKEMKKHIYSYIVLLTSVMLFTLQLRRSDACLLFSLIIVMSPCLVI